MANDIVNVIHCCPEGLPEKILEHLSLSSSSSSSAGIESDQKPKPTKMAKPSKKKSESQEATRNGTGPILSENGWLAIYGPFLADDGSYKSKADEEVRPTHPFPPFLIISLHVRTIRESHSLSHLELETRTGLTSSLKKNISSQKMRDWV